MRVENVTAVSRQLPPTSHGPRDEEFAEGD